MTARHRGRASSAPHGALLSRQRGREPKRRAATGWVSPSSSYIVIRHRGDLRISSAVGKGSTFSGALFEELEPLAMMRSA